ncbi:MAG: hypothetical protein K2X82_17870 [Gemmataceae bacterium]|nr:hypothetical protein [Gemmataceae bacterium]
MIADETQEHGLMTISIYARAHPGVTRKAHEKAFAREVDQGRIKAYALRGREHYYILTGRECKARGLHRKRSRPYGAQALVTHMGYLLYAVEKGVSRLTHAEVAERTPELLVPGLSADRYVLLDDGKTLGLLLVDCGSDVRHIARKVKAQVERRRQASEEWREIIRLRAFRVLVIVAHQQKAKRLRRHLNNWGGEFEVVVFEEMEGLIMENTR